jgi:hypothetical protein
MAMLMKMLGSQGSGNTPAAQGINPATLMNLLSVLGQNVDLGSLMNMMAGMLGTGSKLRPCLRQAARASHTRGRPSRCGVKGGAAAAKTGEEKQARREAPKIMKWDQLDDRKKA